MHSRSIRRGHLIAALAIVAACAGTARAQEALVRAGIASSSLSFERRDSAGAERRPGLAVGASIFLSGADRGGWQLEALLVQKGARNVLRRDDEIRLTYLEVPILLHGDVWQQGNRALYFTVGPSVAFALRATYLENGIEEDIGDDVARVDASLHMGGGMELGRLVLDARYVLGLRTAFVDDDRAFKNRTFLVTAGFRFR